MAFWIRRLIDSFANSATIYQSIIILWLAISIIIMVWLYRHYTSPILKIPGPSYSLIFGNLHELSNEEYMQNYLRWINTHGKITRMHLWFGSAIVLVADPKAFKKILITHNSKYCRPSNFFGPARRLLGNGLGTCPKEDHGWQRRMIDPLFKLNNLKAMFSTFKELADTLKEIWLSKINHSDSNSAIISANSYMGAAASDAIGKFVLNRKFESLKKSNRSLLSEYIKHILSNGFISFLTKLHIPFYGNLPTHGVQEFKKAEIALNNIVDDSLQDKRFTQSKQSIKDQTITDLVGWLMAVQDHRTGQGLTEHQIRDQLMTFIVVGKDTVESCLLWTLYCLAKYQSIQERLRQDIDSNLLPNSNDIDWEAIESMQYLDCVVKESLRLYPPAPAIERTALEDDDICDYHIPKGTTIFLTTAVVQRSEEYWTDPLTFNPDRFKTVDKDYYPYAFIPFGTGSEGCIGKKYAITQIKVIIAVLVSVFRFDIMPECKSVKLVRHETMQPDREIVVKISLA